MAKVPILLSFAIIEKLYIWPVSHLCLIYAALCVADAILPSSGYVLIQRRIVSSAGCSSLEMIVSEVSVTAASTKQARCHICSEYLKNFFEGKTRLPWFFEIHI